MVPPIYDPRAKIMESAHLGIHFDLLFSSKCSNNTEYKKCYLISDGFIKYTFNELD